MSTGATYAESLQNEGIETTLRNNYRWTTDPTEIAQGIKLIDRLERETGFPVAILGQTWTSVAPFETQYRAYELDRANQLKGTEDYGRGIITREYLERRMLSFSRKPARVALQSLF